DVYIASPFRFSKRVTFVDAFVYAFANGFQVKLGGMHKFHVIPNSLKPPRSAFLMKDKRKITADCVAFLFKVS
ncbi:MAG: hypothetical protein QXJ02_06315, partial [Candidatus Bathyarchaeia archaeon]